MKKVIMIMIAIFLLVCISINCFAETKAESTPKTKSIPIIDSMTTEQSETATPSPTAAVKSAESNVTVANTQKASNVSRSIIRRVYSTMMNFQGENKNWKASLLVEDVLTKEGTNKQQFKLKLVPKYSGVYWLSCMIYTNNGVAKENFWQIFQNPIEIAADKPIPDANEDIVIRILAKYSWQQDEFIVLKNVIPESEISLSEAVEIMVNKYYEMNGSYPGENFTYKVEKEDGNWFVIYNDNDNIGGETIMEINGKTGKVEGIKEME